MVLAGLILGYLNLVLILIGIIAALAMVNLGGIFGDGQDQTAKTWVNGTGEAYVNIYYARVGSYPKTLADLKNPPQGIHPFVQRSSDLLDPWGKEYVYKYPGTRNPKSFDLWTTTPEGKVIGNWDDF